MKLVTRTALALALALVFSSTYAHAQGESTTTMEEQASSERLNKLSLDMFPLLLRGYGIVFDRVLAKNVSAGVFISQYGLEHTLKVSGEPDVKTEATLRRVGLRGLLFPLSKASEGGLYLGAAILRADADVKSEMKGAPEGHDSTDGIGAQGIAGYQFLGSEIGTLGKFYFDAAVNYGYGNAIKYKVSYDSLSTNADVKASIENALGLHANVGLLF